MVVAREVEARPPARGFLARPRSESWPVNRTKAMILSELFSAATPMSASQIARLLAPSGVTRGMVSGGLSRYESGDCVRSFEVLLPPNHAIGKAYRLTPYGEQWVRWGVEVGLIVQQQAPEE